MTLPIKELQVWSSLVQSTSHGARTDDGSYRWWLVQMMARTDDGARTADGWKDWLGWKWWLCTTATPRSLRQKPSSSPTRRRTPGSCSASQSYLPSFTIDMAITLCRFMQLGLYSFCVHGVYVELCWLAQSWYTSHGSRHGLLHVVFQEHFYYNRQL